MRSGPDKPSTERTDLTPVTTIWAYIVSLLAVHWLQLLRAVFLNLLFNTKNLMSIKLVYRIRVQQWRLCVDTGRWTTALPGTPLACPKDSQILRKCSR